MSTLSRKDQIANLVLQGASNNTILKTIGTRGTGLTKSAARREINAVRRELRGDAPDAP